METKESKNLVITIKLQSEPNLNCLPASLKKGGKKRRSAKSRLQFGITINFFALYLANFFSPNLDQAQFNYSESKQQIFFYQPIQILLPFLSLNQKPLKFADIDYLQPSRC